MDGHAFRGFKGVDEIVGAGPIPICVPPEGGEGGREAGRVVCSTGLKPSAMDLEANLCDLGHFLGIFSLIQMNHRSDT